MPLSERRLSETTDLSPSHPSDIDLESFYCARTECVHNEKLLLEWAERIAYLEEQLQQTQLMLMKKTGKVELLKM